MLKSFISIENNIRFFKFIDLNHPRKDTFSPKILQSRHCYVIPHKKLRSKLVKTRNSEFVLRQIRCENFRIQILYIISNKKLWSCQKFREIRLIGRGNIWMIAWYCCQPRNARRSTTFDRWFSRSGRFLQGCWLDIVATVQQRGKEKRKKRKKGKKRRRENNDDEQAGY